MGAIGGSPIDQGAAAPRYRPASSGGKLRTDTRATAPWRTRTGPGGRPAAKILGGADARTRYRSPTGALAENPHESPAGGPIRRPDYRSADEPLQEPPPSRVQISDGDPATSPNTRIGTTPHGLPERPGRQNA